MTTQQVLSAVLLATATFAISTVQAFSPTPHNNQKIESFSQAKKKLLTNVYNDHRTTLYCGASFNSKKQVVDYKGYASSKYKKRAKRIEWEHVVPAENFGRTFAAWREGDAQCVNSKGKKYKGRRCANKASKEYRLMQADMYNLFPAIGAVNAYRSNFNFVMQPQEKSDFGACDMRIENKKAQPPKEARGRIARTYLYMDSAYKHFKMSRAQRQLMQAWDKQFPTSSWECQRYQRIKKIQLNENDIMQQRCAA